MKRILLFALLLVWSVAPAASAQPQVDEPDLSQARVRIGPLALSPTINLTNFGIDTNVFNDPPGQERRDTTLTLTPKVDAWLKVGPTWLSGNVREDLVWYRLYTTERSANTTLGGNWLVPLNTVRLTVGGSRLDARDRPGFEIDARVDHVDTDVNGSAEVRMLSRTYIGVRGSRRDYRFADDARFGGEDLRDQLNRHSTLAALTFRHQLTPLTSVGFDYERQQDRFTFSPERNADLVGYVGKVSFDPSALIKGSARVGYREFTPATSAVAGYNGLLMAVDLAYTMLGTTKFTVGATRDIQYSFEEAEPIYLQTGVQGSIAQQIYGPVDAVARVATRALAYRTRSDVVLPFANRTDNVRTYGAGMGYHLGRDLRIGVDVDRLERTSDVAARRYKDLRVGTSVTFGF